MEEVASNGHFVVVELIYSGREALGALEEEQVVHERDLARLVVLGYCE